MYHFHITGGNETWHRYSGKHFGLLNKTKHAIAKGLNNYTCGHLPERNGDRFTAKPAHKHQAWFVHSPQGFQRVDGLHELWSDPAAEHYSATKRINWTPMETCMTLQRFKVYQEKKKKESKVLV